MFPWISQFSKSKSPNQWNGDNYIVPRLIFLQTFLRLNHNSKLWRGPDMQSAMGFTLIVSGIQRATIRKGSPWLRHCREARTTPEWQPRLTCRGELCFNHQLPATSFSSSPLERGKYKALENWPNWQTWQSNTLLKFYTLMFFLENALQLGYRNLYLRPDAFTVGKSLQLIA